MRLMRALMFWLLRRVDPPWEGWEGAGGWHPPMAFAPCFYGCGEPREPSGACECVTLPRLAR